MSATVKKGGVASTLRPYITSGTAAIFASSCVHPMDLIKVRIQVSNTINMAAGSAGGKVPTGFAAIAKNIVQTEGVKGLYKGVTAAFLRQAVYGTARMGLHDTFSRMLVARNDGKPISFWQKTGSAMTAGAIAGLLGNPCDLALVRMEADGSAPAHLRRGYTGVFNAIKRIGQEEGVRSLWRGSVPMVCRAIAMNVGMLATHDQAKELLAPYTGAGTMTTSLSASCISGFVSSFTSLPFDLMKTRMMNMSANAEGIFPYKNLGDCAWKILKNEGVFSFWRGYWTYCARTAPHSMLCLIMKDVFGNMYDKLTGLE